MLQTHKSISRKIIVAWKLPTIHTLWVCTAHEFNSLLHIEAPLILVPPLFSIIFAILHKKFYHFMTRETAFVLQIIMRTKLRILLLMFHYRKVIGLAQHTVEILWFLLLPWIYVKSISAITESIKVSFWQIFELWLLNLVNFSQNRIARNYWNNNSKPTKLSKCQFLCKIGNFGL